VSNLSSMTADGLTASGSYVRAGLPPALHRFVAMSPHHFPGGAGHHDAGTALHAHADLLRMALVHGFHPCAADRAEAEQAGFVRAVGGWVDWT
jgi:hypothetical protein